MGTFGRSEGYIYGHNWPFCGTDRQKRTVDANSGRAV